MKVERAVVFQAVNIDRAPRNSLMAKDFDMELKGNYLIVRGRDGVVLISSNNLKSIHVSEEELANADKSKAEAQAASPKAKSK